MERHRIYANDEHGKLLAEITFPVINGDVVNINHTFVDPSLRGQGIADQLVRVAIAEISKNGMKAKVTCPYVVEWFKKHPDQIGIL